MKNNLHFVLIVMSIFLLFSFMSPIEALNDPVPYVSGSVIYPDTCNPEFHVDFEISNLGATSSPASYLSVTLSSHLEYVNWYTTPKIPDLQIRVFEIGNPVLNISDQSISTKNTIIEVYNHSFANSESIKVTIFFELTLYQSNTEWIKYNLVMFPENNDYQIITPMITDPENSTIINQQGYPVYELSLPINTITVEGKQDDIDIVPEFSSFITLSMFLIISVIVIFYRKLIPEQR